MMAKKIREWRTKSGKRGFLQREFGGWISLDEKYVVYERKGIFRTDKLGEIPTNLTFEVLLEELEKIVGEKVELIWKGGCVPPIFIILILIFLFNVRKRFRIFDKLFIFKIWTYWHLVALKNKGRNYG